MDLENGKRQKKKDSLQRNNRLLEVKFLSEKWGCLWQISCVASVSCRLDSVEQGPAEGKSGEVGLMNHLVAIEL